MAKDHVERKLAAILAADVVGYSRLMERDEAGTLGRLRALRRELFEPKTKTYRGRIFKTTGDGALVEFKSATDAVNSAVEIQRTLAEREAGVAEDRRIRLRIGVSLGDVIVEGSDLYGNGVNVAARMEGLAEPGGICISGNVHEHVRNVVGVTFDDLGKQEVKNITEPVHAYRVRLSSGDSPQMNASLSLPAKPSIAVLPLQNMSGDVEQEYFSDGITEDIITALSQIREFFVIARNTTFAYKGRSVDVQALAAELGVRYVLEGSVRKAGGRVRITAQLIDGSTGSHIWADRYDRDLEDIFALQDEITQIVVGMLGPELSRAEQRRALIKPPDNLDAWELFHRGMFHLYKRTVQDNVEALRLFDLAMLRDPNFAEPYGAAARTRSVDWLLGIRDFDPNLAVRLARRAIELDNRNSKSHHALGHAHILIHRDGAAALSAFEEAMKLNPNDAQIRNGMGMSLLRLGQASEAVSYLQQAIRLSPSDPMMGIFCGRLAMAYFCLKDFDAAVEWGVKAAAKTDVHVERLALPAALACLERITEAKRAVEELLSLWPSLTLKFVCDTETAAHTDYLTALITGLRKAGLPER